MTSRPDWEKVSNHMDIQDLIPQVVQSMQTSGQVRPAIYAQLDTGSLHRFPLFNFIGDGRMKAHVLFAEGRQAGQKHQARELRETCLVTEVWLSREERNPTPGSQPPADAPQKEAVMFAEARNAPPFQTLVKLYEIKRGKKGKAVELVSWNESIDPEGLMGLAFIAGWRSRTMSDAKVQQQQSHGMWAFLQE